MSVIATKDVLCALYSDVIMLFRSFIRFCTYILSSIFWPLLGAS